MEIVKPKILGFCSLLYGKEFLFESLSSLEPYVDKFHIAYTRVPSHGIHHELECPDKEMELFEIAQRALGPKLIWETSWQGFSSEAAHRDQRYKHAEGFQLIISIDADEIYEGVPQAIEYMMNGKSQYYGISGYRNYWKNLDWMLTDGFRPIRGERTDIKDGSQDLECPLTVHHFSLCQSIETIRYKMQTFGHASEIRENYIDGIYLAWTPEKIDERVWLHPTSITIWHHPEKVDRSTLPQSIKDHPIYHKTL